MVFRFICAGLLLLCTGCYNKPRSHTQGQPGPAIITKEEPISKATQVPKISLQQLSCAYQEFVDEAQLADVPVPDIPGTIVTWYKETLTDPRRHVLKYTSTLSLQDCTAFYRVHMEYVGWQEKQLFTGNYEHCLVFKKPSRIAIITVSSELITDKLSTQVTIFTGPRKKIKGA